MVLFLPLALIFVFAMTSRAETPENRPSEQLGPSNLTLPPLEETAKCKDNSKLYVGCDQIFKNACKKSEGTFLCDNQDCSEGTCFLPEKD